MEETKGAALIAPCGLNCGVCRAHLRAKNSCPGCRAEDAAKPVTRVVCRIKTCEAARAGGYSSCGECAQLPCAELRRLDKRYRTRYGLSVIDNLAAIRQEGIAAFLEKERSRWACEACGGPVCMHENTCRGCGRVRPGAAPVELI